MAVLIRNLFILFLIFAAVLIGFLFSHIENRLPQKSYNTLLNDVRDGSIERVDVTGNSVAVTVDSGRRYMTLLPQDMSITEIISKPEVEINFHQDFGSYYFQGGLAAAVCGLLLVLFLSYQSRRVQSRGDDFKFAKDRLVLPTKDGTSVSFKDVAGIPEAKEELEEVIVFLKNPEKFNAVGAVIPRGLLLQGPPGTGKTLLARAIAGEAGVPFYNFSGSDFVEMFVGVGASRVRDLFTEAKKNAPCIVFIDEIDAVGASRTSGAANGNDERGQTLNALLVEMDGFSTTDNILVLAATNRPDILDSALRRPGRFDRQITILAPDLRGRKNILETHSRKVNLADNVDIEEIAQFTSGFTGAELASLVNEAALLAARLGKEVIERQHFDQARDRIMLGVERKGMVLTEADKKILAYHEAGHAIVAKLLPESDPIHKITIIPRGLAMGQTQQLPLGDRYAYGKQYLMDRITMLLGGRAAEKIVFNEFTTRTENDLIQATEIATNIVCRWGMSDSLGPQTHIIQDGGFLDSAGSRLAMSNATAGLIDREVKELLVSCYERALSILDREEEFLKVLSEILLQVETLDSEEFEIIFQCSLTKKAEKSGTIQEVTECSLCPARGQCIQYADVN
ncbi:ATP-dependent zinc metalloprotease FtsH [Desulfopila sp. IMCC35008]|uniref:ATP-dependent zinc metalloprotease FtsH n=1 Tax=Desulfopila sp. IMCC35008 TaxID=2653858 RepID=UPI0013D71176|nr:ATP-dependent zinc metalloprotease FtsH [Desulfopila sp. IMCC35008]